MTIPDDVRGRFIPRDPTGAPQAAHTLDTAAAAHTVSGKPPTKRASIKRLFEEVDESDYKRVITEGLAAKNARTRALYLKMAAEYLDGKPPDHLRVRNDLFTQEELSDARAMLSKKFDRILGALAPVQEPEAPAP